VCFVLGMIFMIFLVGIVNAEGIVGMNSGGSSSGGGVGIEDYEKPGVSGSGVEFDSDLLRAFDDRGFAEDLMGEKNFVGLKVIDDEIWAKVTVILKDKSMVVVEGNKSERKELINQKLEWFKPVIEKFVANLSDDDFMDVNPFSGGFRSSPQQETSSVQ